jgi:hypothetical protein
MGVKSLGPQSLSISNVGNKASEVELKKFASVDPNTLTPVEAAKFCDAMGKPVKAGKDPVEAAYKLAGGKQRAINLDVLGAKPNAGNLLGFKGPWATGKAGGATEGVGQVLVGPSKIHQGNAQKPALSFVFQSDGKADFFADKKDLTLVVGRKGFEPEQGSSLGEQLAIPMAAGGVDAAETLTAPAGRVGVKVGLDTLKSLAGSADGLDFYARYTDANGEMRWMNANGGSTGRSGAFRPSTATFSVTGDELQPTGATVELQGSTTGMHGVGTVIGMMAGYGPNAPNPVGLQAPNATLRKQLEKIRDTGYQGAIKVSGELLNRDPRNLRLNVEKILVPDVSKLTLPTPNLPSTGTPAATDLVQTIDGKQVHVKVAALPAAPEKMETVGFFGLGNNGGVFEIAPMEIKDKGVKKPAMAFVIKADGDPQEFESFRGVGVKDAKIVISRPGFPAGAGSITLPANKLVAPASSLVGAKGGVGGAVDLESLRTLAAGGPLEWYGQLTLNDGKTVYLNYQDRPGQNVSVEKGRMLLGTQQQFTGFIRANGPGWPARLTIDFGQAFSNSGVILDPANDAVRKQIEAMAGSGATGLKVHGKITDAGSEPHMLVDSITH